MKNQVFSSVPSGHRGRILISVIVFSSIAFAGCGGNDWQAETFPAHGEIMINGDPPQGAVITLHPVGEQVDQRGSQPWAIVSGDGSYSLQTYEEADGAPQGEYHVTVRWPHDINDMVAAMTDQLGKAYSNPEQSKWTFTIAEGTNELPLIEIQGVKLQQRTQKQNNRNQPVMPGTGSK